MRLDIFLKLSRLVSKRTLAKEFTQKGLVKVNDLPAKASYEVKVGDEIEIKTYNRVLIAEVLVVPPKKQVSKQGAKKLYQILSDDITENDFLIPLEN